MEGDIVYHIEQTLEQTKIRLNQDGSLNPEVKKAILDFIDDLTLDNLSIHRQYYYITRLKVLGRIMGDSFLHPTKQDIKTAVLKLKASKTRRNGNYADSTMNGIYMTLKKFYRSYDDGKYKESVGWLKLNWNPAKEKKPEDIISDEELNKLLSACRNDRDRALISMLYDSGCRIGELLTLRVKDLEFDYYGLRLTVKGKTGVRRVRVVGKSVALARQYQERSKRNEQDDFFFSMMRGAGPLKWNDVNMMLYKVSKRAGIKRRIHPHLFRHTRATILAKDLKQAPLESTMGWVHGSRMSRIYVNFSDEQVDDAILKVYGIEKQKDGEGNTIHYVPGLCPSCGAENSSIDNYCFRCGAPLGKNKDAEPESNVKETETSVTASSADDNSTKELLKTFDPEFKDEILEAVISEIVRNPRLKERFIKALVTKKRSFW